MTLPDLPDELETLRQRIAADPDAIEAREMLADLLLDLGERKAGLEQLYTAAERLSQSGQFERAITLLGRLVEHAPNDDNAQRLLAKLYIRVPRQTERRLRTEADADDVTVAGDFGERLFSLPATSAEALSRILPFSEEDPAPLHGSIVVPIPPGAAESAQPFLASLDRELRRSGGRPAAPADAGRGLSSAESADDQEADQRAPSTTLHTRISPASRAIGIDELPPNPIIDMLDSERLEALLEVIDLTRYAPTQTVFDRWTPRGLYVVLTGTLHVQRETEGQGMQVVDLLQPGDFFGEFELLTLISTDARIVAAKSAEVLEIPEQVVGQLAERQPEILDLLWDAYFQRSFHSMMATSEIFSQLAVDVIGRIAVELEPLVFETGDLVLREGQAPRGLYGVVGGSLAVVRPSQTGAEVITRLGPGDFFGLVSSASGEPSRASVVATEPSMLLWLARHAMESLRDTVPAFARILREASHNRIWEYKLSR